MTAVKWKIRNLEKQTSFEKAASLTLKQRIRTVKKAVKQYLADSRPESLHAARIALRRLRYALEIFSSCLEKKKYLPLYKLVVKLQNGSGKVRDYSVVKDIINDIPEEGEKEKNFWLEKMNERQNDLAAKLTTELQSFLKCPELKNFSKQLY